MSIFGKNKNLKITKICHACMQVSAGGTNFLIDPGAFCEIPETMPDIDAVLITHEHKDHLHMPFLLEVMKRNPEAKIYSNASVKEILAAEGLKCEVVEDGDRMKVDKVYIQGVGQQHALIHPVVPQVTNVGFIIDDSFFYPGDALTYPDKHIDVLALPVAGPWIKISEAMEYAVKVNPKACFPVHDGMLKFFGSFHDVPALFLPRHGIKFFRMTDNPTLEI